MPSDAELRALAEDLDRRLRAIPVWQVEAMTPGWQEHGTTAYHAADFLRDVLPALLDRLQAAEASNARLREALEPFAAGDPHALREDHLIAAERAYRESSARVASETPDA